MACGFLTSLRFAFRVSYNRLSDLILISTTQSNVYLYFTYVSYTYEMGWMLDGFDI